MLGVKVGPRIFFKAHILTRLFGIDIRRCVSCELEHLSCFIYLYISIFCRFNKNDASEVVPYDDDVFSTLFSLFSPYLASLEYAF